MIGLRRALLGLAAAGLALGVVAVALVASSDHVEATADDLLVGPLIGWSFIATGLFAWWRRPDNRFGLLMTAVGFAWLLPGLAAADAALPFTVGILLSALQWGVLGHMLLAFPTGRIAAVAERRLVAVTYGIALGAPLALLLIGEELDEGRPHPDNLLLVADLPGVFDVVDTGTDVLAFVLALALAGTLAARARAAGPVQRRSLAPLWWTGAALLCLLALSIVADHLGPTEGLYDVIEAVALVLFAALPWAFLAGLLRSRYGRTGAVSDLVARLGTAREHESLRDALAHALGDPTLRLFYRRPGREEWVDTGGNPVAAPEGEVGRVATPLERDGELVGALVHDAALSEEPELVTGAATAAALALDNDRLQAELRARVAELQDSRAKLIAAGLAERRRLERDLHDGAQQRLVALSLQLGLARSRVATEPDAAVALLDAAHEELRHALEELRELARGIHPAVLTERGLDAALEALADRAPVPVELAGLPAERLPPTVEAAAYFVIAESLTNVARYARAEHAEVRVDRRNGHALVEVRDDGVGGADPSSGTGLRGLADRLAGLDGRLEVVSPAGRGTVVRAVIPCASS